MARAVRYIIPKLLHHATQRGNNHQNIFFDTEDHLHFMRNIRMLSKEEGVLVGAYCLMTNHFHLLLYPYADQNLIAFMKGLCQLHTQQINKKYRRSGKLWENRYKLHLVDPDYEWIISRYIDRNPVAANMVGDPLAYTYSSARAHLLGVHDETLTKDVINSRHNEYRVFFEEEGASSPVQISHMQELIKQEKILGKESFVKELEEKFGTCFRLRKRGRPSNNGNNGE